MKSTIPLPSTIEFARVSAEIPVNCEPLPWNDPLKDPEWSNPVAFVVATIFPVPLIAVVVKFPDAPVTKPDDRESTCKFAKFADDPETITFFHVAI